jgi:acetyl-CoA carboxylase alpha subunit
VASGLKKEILGAFDELKGLPPADLIQKRIGKFRNMGQWIEKR